MSAAQQVPEPIVRAAPPCRCTPGQTEGGPPCWGHWEAFAAVVGKGAGRAPRTWADLVDVLCELTERFPGEDADEARRYWQLQVQGFGVQLADALPPDLRERGRACRQRRYGPQP